MSEIGFLYVLANSSMPGLVKVGKTTRSPAERAAELSGVTGMATPFLVVYEQLFHDCHSAESFVHAYLAEKGYRVADNREFFNAPINLIIRAIALAPGIIENGLSTEENPDVTDALISPDVNDELDSLKLIPIDEVAPWATVFDEAEAHHDGRGNYIQDFSESLRLFRQAATLGSSEAYLRLGQQYMKGQGTRKDPVKALEFFKEGARKGRPTCYFLMAEIFSQEKNDENADKCFSLFLKNFPIGTPSESVVSSYELSVIYDGCMHLVVYRVLWGEFNRHAVMNGFITKHKKPISVHINSMYDYALSEGDHTLAKAFKDAGDYIMTL